MGKRFIDGSDFRKMVFSSAKILNAQVNTVNALNVFPVPDGDTGTNMNLTLTSGVAELRKKPSPHIGKAAEVLSKGLLMGARGNSGVILSQLFRGFAKSVAGLEQVNTAQFASALQQGVETAYQAVVRPVEGTILTVSKETAKHAVSYSRRTGDFAEFMPKVLNKAKEALAKTPDLLPVLKQVGVVDSGGQGLVFIYEGFMSYLTGEQIDTFEPVKAVEISGKAGAQKQAAVPGVSNIADQAAVSHRTSAQSKIATEAIEYRYDMEFFIDLSSDAAKAFDDAFFRRQLAKDGDSILVIVNDDIVKVHVHSRKPGDVLNLALPYGELSRIQIENMRDQHRNLLTNEDAEAGFAAIQQVNETEPTADKQPAALKRFGMVAVAMGEGISDIFSSLGVDHVLTGGQTMNPSTQDIVNAVNEIRAETVFILPNNSNIILAAQQAKDLVDKQIVVIPSKTIPQGMAAVLAFQEGAGADVNEAAMNRAVKQVRSGQITYAVRDTHIDELTIKQGDFIGIYDNKIVASAADLLDTCKLLLDQMIMSGEEILTMFVGEDAEKRQTEALSAFVNEAYPDVEMEIHPGGQPLYYYIFSVE